jgi:hypothetical protein
MKEDPEEEPENLETTLNKMTEREKTFFKTIFDFNTLASFTSGTAC